MTSLRLSVTAYAPIASVSWLLMYSATHIFVWIHSIVDQGTGGELAEYNEVHSRLRAFMNGRLTTTLIALNLNLDRRRSVPSELSGETLVLPFAPFRAFEADTETQDGEIGLGGQQCRCIVLGPPESTPTVRFGRSIGTMVDNLHSLESTVLRDDDAFGEALFGEGSWFYEGPNRRCLSLWSTDVTGVAVLAIEQLERSPREPPMTIDHSITGLVGLLKGSGDSSEITLRTLGFDLDSDPKIDVSLSELIVRSVDSVRGDFQARALTVVFESGMQEQISKFMKMNSGNLDFDAVEEQQATGYVPMPKKLDLVSEPATVQNCSAASSDGRLILLNLDSMSVHHDYLGAFSERLVAATMPVLCDTAATEVLLNRLRTGFDTAAHDSHLDSQLQLISDVRMTQMRRSLVRSTAGREQSIRWSNSGHLASFLYLSQDDLRTKIADVTDRSVETVEAITAIQRQRRDDSNAKVAAALTGVATFFACIGVLSALLAVPPGPWHWLADAAVVIAIVPVILLVPVFVVWWRERKAHSARHY